MSRTATHRHFGLEQDGSSGFTPQTWDVAGNEANFFIRDATSGSTLPFRIRPGGAPTNSLVIDGDGDIGVGTLSPNDGQGDAERFIEVKDGNDVRLVLDSGNAAGEFGEVHFQASNTSEWGFGSVAGTRFYVFNYNLLRNDLVIDTADGNIGIAGCRDPDHAFEIGGGTGCNAGGSEIDPGETQFTVSSSRSLKENLEPVAASGILDTISDVGVYTYDFIDGPKERLGLMSEDFHRVFGRGSDKKINGGDVQMALWLAVQGADCKGQSA